MTDSALSQLAEVGVVKGPFCSLQTHMPLLLFKLICLIFIFFASPPWKNPALFSVYLGTNKQFTPFPEEFHC